MSRVLRKILVWFQQVPLTPGDSTRHIRNMSEDDTITPMDRVQGRIALHLAEKRLARRRDLRAEIRHTCIAHYIEALLEFGVTEPQEGREPEAIESLEDAVTEAAAKFGVADSTAWTAWRRSRTYLSKRSKR